jgi:CIC family chloride channel protein
LEEPTSDRKEERIEQHRHSRRAQIGRAAVVGAIAGLCGVGFQLAVQRAEVFSLWIAGHYPAFVVITMTGVIGSLAAWCTGRFAPEAGGSGIPHIKAVLLHVRILRPWHVIAVKLGAGLLALGAGFSLGREGPTVQIGAAVGKLVGDLFRIPKRSYGALIATGAGAGLAAAFNAPLAGFIFVMEELKREMSPLTYGTALVGSVCSVAATRFLLGQSPSFHIPTTHAPALVLLAPIALLGVIAGGAGVLFNRALLGALILRTRFHIPRWAAGLGVGVLSGLLLIYFPEVTGGGHEIASNLLAGQFSSPHLLALALAIFAGKLVFTALSYGTGVPGGIFAPILVMGAFLGFAYGIMAERIMPSVEFGPAGYATIGMASLLAASVRAPLTGVVLIVEMTAEYQLLYALLVGAFMAYATAELLGDEPVYEALLERDLKSSEPVGSEDMEPVFIDFLVEPDSHMDGSRIRELRIPEGALVTGIVRNRKHVVPRGGTQIRAGDMLTATIEGDNLQASAALHEMAKAPS